MLAMFFFSVKVMLDEFDPDYQRGPYLAREEFTHMWSHSFFIYSEWHTDIFRYLRLHMLRWEYVQLTVVSLAVM